MQIYVYTMQAWDDRCNVYVRVENDVTECEDGWKVNKSRYPQSLYKKGISYNKECGCYRATLASDSPEEDYVAVLKAGLSLYLMECSCQIMNELYKIGKSINGPVTVREEIL